MNRRRFLAVTGAALAVPNIIVSRAWGRPAPSNRIALGVVGCGGMGASNTRSFLNQKDCQVVAACHVDKDHLAQVTGIINRHYQKKDCQRYHDFRELMARKDIDAVMLAVPDNWHQLVA